MLTLKLIMGALAVQAVAGGAVDAEEVVVVMAEAVEVAAAVAGMQ